MRTDSPVYYEMSTAPRGRAVVDDDELHPTTLCAGCAQAFPVGARWGDHIIIARARVNIDQARTRADLDCAACDQCGVEIIPEFCRECDMRQDECACDECADYRPERMAGGGWLQ